MFCCLYTQCNIEQFELIIGSDRGRPPSRKHIKLEVKTWAHHDDEAILHVRATDLVGTGSTVRSACIKLPRYLLRPHHPCREHELYGHSYCVNTIRNYYAVYTRNDEKSKSNKYTPFVYAFISINVCAYVCIMYKLPRFYLDKSPHWTKTSRTGRSRSWPSSMCRSTGKPPGNRSASVCPVYCPAGRQVP